MRVGGHDASLLDGDGGADGDDEVTHASFVTRGVDEKEINEKGQKPTFQANKLVGEGSAAFLNSHPQNRHRA